MFVCVSVCSDMNHRERSVLLKGRRNGGDRSDELHFVTIFLAAPEVILNCVDVCKRH